MESTPPRSSLPSSPTPPDVVRQRRRWLYAFTGLAIAAVLSIAAVELFADQEQERRRRAPLPTAATGSVVLARIELKPVGGSRSRGLAELARRNGREYVRVVGAYMKRNVAGEVYQVLLAGGEADEPRLLGNVVVESRTLIGEAVVPIEEVKRYSRIEIRRVGQGTPPPNKLVLRGRIPR